MLGDQTRYILTRLMTEGLDETDLDRTGRHPVLGEITMEDFVNAIYGHQLLHMRDLQALFRS